MCVICVCSHIQTSLQGRRALLLLPVSNLKDVILLPSLDENKSVTSNILHRDTPTISQHTEKEKEKERERERERATVWLDTIHSVPGWSPVCTWILISSTCTRTLGLKRTPDFNVCAREHALQPMDTCIHLRLRPRLLPPAASHKRHTHTDTHRLHMLQLRRLIRYRR